MISTKHLTLAAALVILTGCQANGDIYRSDVYTAGEVNRAQQVQTVEIVAINPAQVAVNNSQNRATNQFVTTTLGGVIGGLLGAAIDPHGPGGATVGAIAGAAIGAGASNAVSPNQALVNGVQITFRLGNNLYNSAQVGRPCEFRQGPALMVSTNPTSTRIQPNNPNGCPQPQ